MPPTLFHKLIREQIARYMLDNAGAFPDRRKLVRVRGDSLRAGLVIEAKREGGPEGCHYYTIRRAYRRRVLALACVLVPLLLLGCSPLGTAVGRSLGFQGAVKDQAYTTGWPITPLVLPSAAGLFHDHHRTGFAPDGLTSRYRGSGGPGVRAESGAGEELDEALYTLDWATQRLGCT